MGLFLSFNVEVLDWIPAIGKNGHVREAAGSMTELCVRIIRAIYAKYTLVSCYNHPDFLVCILASLPRNARFTARSLIFFRGVQKNAIVA